MTAETLPELIHRLVQAKGQEWVERELGYSPDIIGQHLDAYARTHALPSEPPTPPDQITPDIPLLRSSLALHLRVRHDTLSRALRNDPAAPRPVPGSDPPRWHYAEVYTWWPSRRQRGKRGRGLRPRTPADPPADEGEGAA